MNYYEYMKKACDEIIVQADNGLFYLEPAWRTILDSLELEPAKMTDFKLGWEAVKEYAELQVKKLNTIRDSRPIVSDWLADVITASVEPAVTEEETDYLKVLTEYLRTKRETAQ